uniref:Bradykinin-potentiating peptide S4,1,2 n=1 Tax=Bothrops insularis TaxID=8723 RepID=BPP4_BOTIN|nr:RecName: Full=Bradykinin-potentiating peptide S4,1,2; Short=BPP; AltName: Full=Angiotensin-converting enzyme inhibitor [Bothrops insularis]
QGGPPRPQIPP